MPASWRADCHSTRAVACRRAGFSRRKAISVTVQRRDSTQRHIVCPLIPCRRVPRAGSCRHDQNKGGRFLPDQTDNVCCVPSRKQGQRPASERREKRNAGRSLMPTPPQSQQPTRWGGWSRCLAERASARTIYSDVQAIQWNGMTGGLGLQGKRQRQAVERIGWWSDSLKAVRQVRRVSAARSWNEVGAVERLARKFPAVLALIADVLPVRSIAGYCRCLGRTKSRGLMLMSWPIGGASRPLASFGAPLSLTVSAVCVRRNERKHPAESA